MFDLRKSFEDAEVWLDQTKPRDFLRAEDRPGLPTATAADRVQGKAARPGTGISPPVPP